MKDGIHPAYYQAKVTCNCGNEFVTGSTKKEIRSIRVSRRPRRPAAVWNSLTGSMA